jgi:hypothetical protein
MGDWASSWNSDWVNRWINKSLVIVHMLSDWVAELKSDTVINRMVKWMLYWFGEGIYDGVLEYVR